MIKHIEQVNIQQRVTKIQKMFKGIQRVHKQIVKEHNQLVKDVDQYHRQLIIVKPAPHESLSSTSQ